MPTPQGGLLCPCTSCRRRISWFAPICPWCGAEQEDPPPSGTDTADDVPTSGDTP